jgi:transketolase
MAGMQGNVAIAMGRSKLPCVLAENGEPFFAGDYVFEYGRIDVVGEGGAAYILAMGTPAGSAIEAVHTLRGEGLAVGVAIVSCPLDLDDSVMARITQAPVIFTVEDHSSRSGLGASVADWLSSRGVAARVVRLGLHDYQSSGSASDLYAGAGLDAAGIAGRVREELGT